MIVVDSSVWIATIRKLDTPQTRKLAAIISDGDEAILVGDVVLLEVLRGARNLAHAARLERELRRFSVATMLNVDLAVRAASNYRILRDRGITIRKAMDLIIGTFCIERGHRLLHSDRDFEPMHRHLGLQAA